MNPPLPVSRSPLLAVGLLSLLFVGATGGAWAWFHVSPQRFPVSFRFDATNRVEGWRFAEEPVAASAVEILATTNLFNGTFVTAQGERVTVFMGTWDANNPQQMSVVGHTPDVCWVGAGWKPVQVGHPDKLTLHFGPHEVPFEARSFQTPDGRSRELTVWCTLVSGQVYAETGRFELPEEAAGRSRREMQAYGARHTLVTKLVKAVGERIPGDGTKQFVRFSTALDQDWTAAYARLGRFGERWLRLEASSPEASTGSR